jgi:FAD/FMN-containing dehydrogenase
VRAGAETEPDLFGALRGGGGGFGVVTALEFRLFPLETVHAGWLIWPWEEASPVLRRWAEWVETVPDGVASIGRLLQVPPLPDVPEMVRARALVVIEAAIVGDEAEGARLLEPLRELAPEIDTFAQIPAAGLGALHMDPPEPVPGIGDGSLFDELPAEAVDALVAVAGPDSGSPLLSVEVRHMGGALERVPDDAGSLGHLDGHFLLYAVGLPMTPEMGPVVAERVQRVNAVMSEWGDGRRFMNFADAPADTGTMFDPEVFRRLREIRDRVDPDGVLRPNHALPGAD